MFLVCTTFSARSILLDRACWRILKTGLFRLGPTISRTEQVCSSNGFWHNGIHTNARTIACRISPRWGVYGARNDQASLDRATKLGFNTTILANETINDMRAVTIMLSPDTTVHLQLWARPEEEVSSSPDFPTVADFEEGALSNQINGGQPASAKEFCKSGTWTVFRFNLYMKQTHESTYSPAPPLG